MGLSTTSPTALAPYHLPNTGPDSFSTSLSTELGRPTHSYQPQVWLFNVQLNLATLQVLNGHMGAVADQVQWFLECGWHVAPTDQTRLETSRQGSQELLVGRPTFLAP